MAEVLTMRRPPPWFLVLGLVVFLTPIVWPTVQDAIRDWRNASKRRSQKSIGIPKQNYEPPVFHMVTAADRAAHPRDSFAVELTADNGFKISTLVSTVTVFRSFGGLPDTTIELRLSTAQIDTLYELALGARLFEMQQPPVLETFTRDASSAVLTLRSGNAKAMLRHQTWSLSEPWTEDHKRLNAFVTRLYIMVIEHPAYSKAQAGLLLPL